MNVQNFSNFVGHRHYSGPRAQAEADNMTAGMQERESRHLLNKVVEVMPLVADQHLNWSGQTLEDRLYSGKT